MSTQAPLLQLVQVPGLSRCSSMLDFLQGKKVRKVHLPWSGTPTHYHSRECHGPALWVPASSLPTCTWSCSCSSKVFRRWSVAVMPQECLHFPALKISFPDVPWEVTVNMGKCFEPTYTDGLFCLPTKFNTVLVRPPQGRQVVWTLERCEMKEKCYRASQMEYYYEIVSGSVGCREEQIKGGFLQLDVLAGGFCCAAGPVCTAGWML
ncbi:uncharacterized protein LOC104062077 [Cuculus canorus]|uniref:uncharacterized protein LOC104062077 n=1 Tax=Cuculus canorus TaxID=55661 RepID=UPI0023AADC66|nr:uncharacterized protein LOC104062077 [Cuculus canorus]